MPSVICNYICKHQENEVCTKDTITLDGEIGGCKNFEFDPFKGCCGNCEYFVSDVDEYCDIDNEFTTHDKRCRNGKYEGV